MSSGPSELIRNAWKSRIVVPAFNIPYLPMMESVVAALRDTASFGLIQVARLEWTKFESGSLQAIRDEYERFKDTRYTRLHLDHVPVIDEDGLRVDYENIFGEAIDLGYESLMVDGCRLSLEDNIAATKTVARMAHDSGLPIEAELGAIAGHEAGPMPPYEELFKSGRGFTDPAEAKRFVAETGVDWLSVAIGNIHGAISGAARTKKKISARLDLDHLKRIADAVKIPLVLHGGSGIPVEYIRESVRCGIAKINIGTAIRQPYEQLRDRSIPEAKRKVYEECVRIIDDELGIRNSAEALGLSG